MNRWAIPEGVGCVARCHNGKSRLMAALSYIQALWGLASSGLTKAYELIIRLMPYYVKRKALEDSSMMPEGQPEFQYDDKALATIEKYVSPERLAAYINYARGDKWVAIRLYERNTEISEALYGVIQALEVTLRNAIHNVLSERLGGPEWYDSFSLAEPEREAVEQAKKNVLDRPATLTPGRVIAELTFAFWGRLFSDSYDKTLWVPHLQRIFPLKLQGRRSQIRGRLLQLKTLRNRIAHHERLICGRQHVQQDYADILETIGWINPTIRGWAESTNCCQERFTKPLPKKPKTVQVAKAQEAEHRDISNAE